MDISESKDGIVHIKNSEEKELKCLYTRLFCYNNESVYWNRHVSAKSLDPDYGSSDPGPH